VRKGLRTRLAIVQSSAALMNRRGWLSTPVSAVLKGTGLKKGDLYNHFDSMADLSSAAFEFASEQLIALVHKQLSRSAHARDRLRDLLNAFDIFAKRRPPFDAGCPILNAATEVDDIDDRMRGQVVEAIDKILGLLEAVIAEGILRGEIRPEIVPTRSARLLFACFEGGVMLSGVTRDPALFVGIKSDLSALIETWFVLPEKAP
jgi:TetR/AcrR family transcriptional regulator, transcriptional repressor for nem operon